MRWVNGLIGWVIGGIIGLLGLGLLVLAWHLGQASVEFMSRAVPVKGEIVGQVQDTCSYKEGKRTVSYICYQPVVRYENHGDSSEAALKEERSSDGFKVGTPVALLIDFSETPHRIEFEEGDRWVGPIVAGVFGLLLLGMATLAVWLIR